MISRINTYTRVMFGGNMYDIEREKANKPNPSQHIDNTRTDGES